jgi:MIP family channel proteins
VNRGSLSTTFRPVTAEFIATLLFVFIGAGSVVVTGRLVDDLSPARMLVIAIANGLAIATLVAATAHISGAHFNPAVTFGALLTRRISIGQGIAYMLAQMTGAVLAVLLLVAVIPGLELGEGGLASHALGSGVQPWQGLVLEMVLTFILVFTIFGAALDRRGVRNLAPLAIGMAVLIDQLMGMPLTGASMNPARSLGSALVGWVWTDHWIYWLGPIIGAATAALVYQHIFEERSP